MESFVVGRRFARRLLLTILLMALVAFAWAAAFGFGPASIEEGPLERMQEVLLIVSALLFLGGAVFQRGPGRMASYGVMLLSIVFFLRELELPVTGPVTAYLKSSAFRLHETIGLLVLGLPYLALRWRYIPAFIAYARALQGWPFVLSAAFLVAGEVAESFVPTMRYPEFGMFLEEAFETLAYVVLACLGAKVLGAALARSAAVRPRAGPGGVPCEGRTR